ncbi:MAG: tRNA lysidine(34) synthetase TilS [Oscillospiraceae bacterium]|nr:tRNA lysidine(34) synthetase TilS [Oscillospiraceae bacterium]
MSKIPEAILRFYDENSLDRGRKVLVCVSGGADSVCLMHAMRALFGEKVSVCHFNHNLRAGESDGDERFVREYCEKNGIEFFSGSGDVAAYASSHSIGTEDAARRLRYEFFGSVCGSGYIATAHSADDQLETILLRIARGTGLKGLCGIPPVRGNIIRPLLGVTRADIEEYISENSLTYRTDSTNLTDDYARNLVRHRVVPALRELNPRCAEHSENMAKALREDEKYLEEASNGELSFSELSALPYSLAARRLMAALPGLEHKHIKPILMMKPGDLLSVPGAVLRREWDELVIDPEKKTFAPVILSGNECEIPELGLKITKEDIISDVVHKSFTSFLFKKQKVCGNITVRPRKEGDAIRLSEKSGTKSLKKLFIECKIPAHERSAVPVICDERGVIAVLGIGSDARTHVKPGDESVKITFIKENTHDRERH